jgi:hypothetical protein
VGGQNLKLRVIEISQDYLGPAAERFIDRQIATHLKKSPESITPKDLGDLLDWLRLSFTVLTDDSRLVNEYIKRLQKVAAAKSGQ